MIRQWGYFVAGKEYELSCQVQGSNPAAYTKLSVGQKELKISDFEVHSLIQPRLMQPSALTSHFGQSSICIKCNTLGYHSPTLLFSATFGGDLLYKISLNYDFTFSG